MLIQELEDFMPHGGGLHVAAVVAQQLPSILGSGLGVSFLEMGVDAVQTGGRSKPILVARQGEMRTG